MSDSREKDDAPDTHRLIDCYELYFCLFDHSPALFPVADCPADARRQPGRFPAAAKRRGHRHAGLSASASSASPSSQAARQVPARCSAQQAAISGPMSPLSSSCPGLKGNKYSFRRYSLVAVAIGIPVIYLGGVLQLKGVARGCLGSGRHERRRPFIPWISSRASVPQPWHGRYWPWA